MHSKRESDVPAELLSAASGRSQAMWSHLGVLKLDRSDLSACERQLVGQGGFAAAAPSRSQPQVVGNHLLLLSQKASLSGGRELRRGGINFR